MSEANGSTALTEKQIEELSDLCPVTKVALWDEEEFHEFEAEYLNQVYPEKLNRYRVSEGVEFVFNFLSCSLQYWVELV